MHLLTAVTISTNHFYGKKSGGNIFNKILLGMGTQIQWKPLNVILLGQMETDNINRMITISGYFYIVICIVNA